MRSSSMRLAPEARVTADACQNHLISELFVHDTILVRRVAVGDEHREVEVILVPSALAHLQVPHVNGIESAHGEGDLQWTMAHGTRRSATEPPTS